MSGKFVTNLEVRGQRYKVSVDSRGKFNAEVSGETVEADSLKALEEKLAKVTKQKAKKIAIPFVRWEGEALKRGTITGVHSGNKNLLIRWEGEKGVDQEYGGSSFDGIRYLDMTADQQAEYTRLCNAAMAADAAAETYAKLFRFDPRKRVEEIIGEG